MLHSDTRSRQEQWLSVAEWCQGLLIVIANHSDIDNLKSSLVHLICRWLHWFRSLEFASSSRYKVPDLICKGSWETSLNHLSELRYDFILNFASMALLFMSILYLVFRFYDFLCPVFSNLLIYWIC